MANRDNRFSVYVGNLPPTTIQGHFEDIFPGCKWLGEHRIRVNHAQDRPRGRGGGAGQRGGFSRGARNGYGREGFGQPKVNQDSWSSRGRPSMNNGGRFGARGGGMAGRGRQSFQLPGASRDVLPKPTLDTGDANSNSSGEGVHRLNLKPRTLPLESREVRELSERAKAIFGTGRPREASPVRETTVTE
ncbi:unnamed protein product [Echinostoma caproni]|uniref:RRM domain-containing protein n=1 Tax=Echinostoma caproni TaxID=27848 RepID=A0A183ASB0_9TREM|nr:unnamed protein product [Echinostoma caproni]